MSVRKIRATKGMSTVVQFCPTASTVKMVKDIRNRWPGRIEEAKRYFLLDVGNYMLSELKNREPDIDEKYAEGLRIGLLEEGSGEDVIAIYRKGIEKEIMEGEQGKTVLYFRPHKRSPDWVYEMVRYGPWPAEMVPVRIKKGDADIVSRRARPDEIRALSERLHKDAVGIETALSRAGARAPAVSSNGNWMGISAHVDLGFNILRRELGLDGEKRNAHWRPVFRDTKRYAKKCMKKVVKYIETGNKKIFEFPRYSGRINSSIVGDSGSFSKEIAPFLKS